MFAEQKILKMKKDLKTLVLTNRKCYTEKEVKEQFSEYVSPENMQVLIDHIVHPELACYVSSFAEIEGEIHVMLDDKEGLIKISRK